jgi:mannose-6-phosphate isomerase-like protein (cupin superfamily)
MNTNLIQFDALPWETPSPGVKQKIVIKDHQRLRLLQFDDQFVEEQWCTKAHVGFVVSGTMTIDFDGTIKQYVKGDGLWIDAGESQKHKVMMGKGCKVELILFEKAP